MAVVAKTVETYSTPLIFEDLQNAFKLISPTECPFQQAIGEGSVDSTHYEWPVVALNAIDPANRVIEGEDAPATDDRHYRRPEVANYTQISDKKIIVSNTSEAVDAAADNLQKLAKQMVYKMKEMKRDIEWMLLMNVPAPFQVCPVLHVKPLASLPSFAPTRPSVRPALTPHSLAARPATPERWGGRRYSATAYGSNAECYHAAMLDQWRRPFAGSGWC